MSREKSSRVLVIVLIATFVSCILLGMFAIRTPKAGNGKQKGLIWEPVGFVEYSWAQAETLMRKKGEWISSAKIEIGTGNLYLTLSGGDKFFITDGGNSAKCMEALLTRAASMYRRFILPLIFLMTASGPLSASLLQPD